MNIAAPPPQPDDKSGKVGVHDRSVLARAQTIMKTYEDVEIRNHVDIPMHHLAKKYEKEFQKADEHIAKRTESWMESARMNLLYDYNNDRRYKFWLNEKEEAKEHLHEHWIDGELDSFSRLWRHGVRAFSGVGIAYGIYRTRFLWKTMDRNYVKLHGVGLSSIATYEVPLACLKGVGIGVIWALGCITGDIFGRLYFCLRDDTTTRQRRQWQNVAGAGLFSGFGVAACMFGLTWGMMPLKTQALMCCGIWSTMTGAAVVLGKAVYAPWVEKYPQSYDDPHHVPWQYRRIRIDGGAATRGRYT